MKAIRTFLLCVCGLFVVWGIIHRSVIAAWVSGDEMPEPPEWHKKCFGIGSDEED